MTKDKPVKHVGIILDGNRRWAKANDKSVMEGHRAGHEALINLTDAVKELDITHLSVYAFSTENWNRSKDEVDNLMELFRAFAEEDTETLHEQNVRVTFMGSQERVSKDLLKLMRDAEEKTKNNTAAHLVICFNYGGHQEIADAFTDIINERVKEDTVTPELIEKHLYEPELPPLDLIIRTSGEKRLSNFMLWRAAYAELAFTDTFWPDFDGKELKNILEEFESRSRRFGK